MKSIPCPLCCNSTFGSLPELKKHLSDVVNNIRCPVCAVYFNDMTTFMHHLDKCNGSQRKNITRSVRGGNKPASSVVPKENSQDDTQAAKDRSSKESAKNVQMNGIPETKGSAAITVPSDTSDEDSGNEGNGNDGCANNMEDDDDGFFCTVCRCKITSIKEHVNEFHHGQQVILQESSSSDNDSDEDEEEAEGNGNDDDDDGGGGTQASSSDNGNEDEDDNNADDDDDDDDIHNDSTVNHGMDIAYNSGDDNEAEDKYDKRMRSVQKRRVNNYRFTRGRGQKRRRMIRSSTSFDARHLQHRNLKRQSSYSGGDYQNDSHQKDQQATASAATVDMSKGRYYCLECESPLHSVQNHITRYHKEDDVNVQSLSTGPLIECFRSKRGKFPYICPKCNCTFTTRAYLIEHLLVDCENEKDIKEEIIEDINATIVKEEPAMQVVVKPFQITQDITPSYSVQNIPHDEHTHHQRSDDEDDDENDTDNNNASDDDESDDGPSKRFKLMTDRGTLLCDVCGAELKNFKEYAPHRYSHSAEEEDPLYHCDICGRSFAFFSSIKLHILHHLISGPYKPK